MSEARVYIAISDPVRRQVLVTLAEGEARGCDLLGGLGLEKQTLTYAMSRLLDMGLVACERDGRSRIYALTSTGKAAARGIAVIDGGGK